MDGDNMSKKNTYWELVRRFRESDDDSIREESLGLYCSKERAMTEREIYVDTEIHEVLNEETVELKIRKFTETIEEVELISIDELNSLAESFESETYYG
tara:strand:+ start:391 stop:687 length:297 start_codon:yes stop_codon:yes gene_type:complete